MSQKPTIRNSPSNEKTNKFYWIYSTSVVDKYLQRGWKYTFPALPEDIFSSVEEFNNSIQEYEKTHTDLGPIGVAITYDCDHLLRTEIYHQTPLTEEEIDMLEQRRQELINAESASDKVVIRRYIQLLEKKPEWVAKEFSNIREALENERRGKVNEQ